MNAQLWIFFIQKERLLKVVDLIYDPFMALQKFSLFKVFDTLLDLFIN